MSEAQEAAQLLGGVSMPQEVIKSLLRGTDLIAEGGDYGVGFISLSPYDGAFEQCALGLRETVAVKLMQDPSPNPSLPHEDALSQGDLPLPKSIFPCSENCRPFRPSAAPSEALFAICYPNLSGALPGTRGI